MRCSEPLRASRHLLPPPPFRRRAGAAPHSAVAELGVVRRHPAPTVKGKLLIFSIFLLVPLFEVACSHLPIMDWFWLHVGLVLAVVICGAVACRFRSSRRLSYLLLSAGVIALLAGISAYILFPLFESPSQPATSSAEALAHVLGHALGPIFYASIAYGGRAVFGLAARMALSSLTQCRLSTRCS